jgi:hypothetical protein
MRLLHRDALDRLILTDFRGKPIPPYAILSHRWSDFEILIEDVLNGTYKGKEESYQKLRFCAEQAAQDGLQYFWIDTCCIDTWDNHERSRAINSMFQWYRNAARCYVFLSDVSVSSATDASQRSNWEVSFRNSKWFTRGWTLQELIAPVSVEFFSCEGRRIGDKKSLDQLIHDRTSIPLAALHNCAWTSSAHLNAGNGLRIAPQQRKKTSYTACLGFLASLCQSHMAKDRRVHEGDCRLS